MLWKWQVVEMELRVRRVCGVFTPVLSHSASTHRFACANRGARLLVRNSPTSSWTEWKEFVQLPLPQRGRRSMHGAFDVLSLGIGKSLVQV